MAARIKSTKRYKALLALLNGDEAAATRSWNALNPENKIEADEPEGDPRIKELVAAGFTKEQAEQAVALTEAENKPVSLVKEPKAKKDKKAKAEPETNAEPVPLTSREQADALVAKTGLTHVRGRVYSTPETIEAQVRVLKTGKPEVVSQPGEHHIRGVVIFRTDDGSSVAVQNLGQPN